MIHNGPMSISEAAFKKEYGESLRVNKISAEGNLSSGHLSPQERQKRQPPNAAPPPVQGNIAGAVWRAKWHDGSDPYHSPWESMHLHASIPATVVWRSRPSACGQHHVEWLG